MSSVSKRGRACQACSSIKIRCSLGQRADGAKPPCERCSRLDKDCVLTAPKRQKDRVAELEAQVAALTRLLQTQGIHDPEFNTASSDGDDNRSSSQSVTSPGLGTLASKKRRLDESSPEQAGHSDTHGTDADESSTAPQTDSDVAKLDSFLSIGTQESTLQRYCNEILPVFPLVPLPNGSSLLTLREKRPVILLAILYGAAAGCLSAVEQEHVAQLLLDRLANSALEAKDSRLDLMQALQIAALWYRTPEHHKHVSIFHLIQLCSGLAAGISLAGPLSKQPPRTSCTVSREREEGDTADVHRACIGAHVLAASMSVFMRRPIESLWNHESENALMMLQYSTAEQDSGDTFLCQYFRAERLMESIAEVMELRDVAVYHDVSTIKDRVQTCRNKILNWKMLLPVYLRIPTLLFWEHVATCHIHEAVLHTSTNKQSFAAPYIPENLSLTDYPAPIVTEDHITAIYELVVALHAIIDIFAAFDTDTLLALPGLMYASRAAYAQYLLAKLYIALTMPGNTLGSVMESRMLAVPEYAEKLREIATRVRAIEPNCAPARILNSARRTMEWYTSYNNSLVADIGILQGLDTGPSVDPIQMNGMPSSMLSAPDWQTLYQLSEGHADFGLDILFAEPLPYDQTLGGVPYVPGK